MSIQSLDIGSKRGQNIKYLKAIVENMPEDGCNTFRVSVEGGKRHYLDTSIAWESGGTDANKRAKLTDKQPSSSGASVSTSTREDLNKLITSKNMAPPPPVVIECLRHIINLKTVRRLSLFFDVFICCTDTIVCV